MLGPMDFVIAISDLKPINKCNRIFKYADDCYLAVLASSTEKCGFSSHIKHLTIKARQSFYALRILRSHGLSGNSLFDVVRATTVGMMLYCSPVWWGFARAQERETLDGIIRRLVRQRYLPSSSPSFVTLCSNADTKLFACILHNPCHVLHKLLPPKLSNLATHCGHGPITVSFLCLTT